MINVNDESVEMQKSENSSARVVRRPYFRQVQAEQILQAYDVTPLRHTIPPTKWRRLLQNDVFLSPCTIVPAGKLQ